MADMQNALINSDINTILNATNKKFNKFEYQVWLHTPDLDYEFTLIKTVEIMRNFNENLGDHVILTGNIPAGIFVKYIYPFRDVLEATIYKVFPKGEYDNIFTRYKAVLINNTGAIEGSRFSNSSEAELNAKEMFDVQIQAIERELIGLMNQPVKGFKFKEVPDRLIPSAVYSSVKELKIEGEPISFSFDMVKPDNKREISVNIPTGMNVIEVPTYLQMIESGGVYNHGIGCYFYNYLGFNPSLWVYPLFSPHRFYNSDGMKPTFLFFYTGTSKYDNVENTYTIDGNCVKIIANSKSSALDKGETEHVNTGDSVIMPSQSGMADRNVELGEKTPSVDPAGSASGHGVKQRRDGFNIAKVVNTNNTCKYFSGLNMKSMTQYTIHWQYADPDLIYPGAPCAYCYQHAERGVIKLAGQIQGVYFRYAKEQKTISALITIMVQNPAFYSDEL